MKQWFFYLFVLGFATLSYAEKGIVVAVNDRFATEFFLASLSHLRSNLKCTLPIEIWHSGDELSNEMKEQLKKYPKVSFCDIAKVLQVDPGLYRGWHMKPQSIALSRFDEVILMDADVFFFENPERLFEEPGYLKTGAFFFCDLSHLFPVQNDPIFTLERYLDRRSFILTLVAAPSSSVPQDMKELWSKEIPTFEKPFIGDLQESGCMAINKKLHQKSLKQIVALNENRSETYRHVHGDKETFWLGCEMAGVPYHMNAQRAYSLQSGATTVSIVQFLGDQLFFQQKKPISLKKEAVFINHAGHKRLVTQNELAKIKQAHKQWYKCAKAKRQTH